MILLLRRVLSNNQLKNFSNTGIRLNHPATISINSRMKGTGSIFPMMARGKTEYQGIPSKLIPKGIAPLSSIMGRAAIITMTSSGGIPAEIRASLIFSADNQASLVINL
jgi:hypothetical protein